jgi:transposase
MSRCRRCKSSSKKTVTTATGHHRRIAFIGSPRVCAKKAARRPGDSLVTQEPRYLRELIFLHEERQQIWAGEMKDLLLEMKAAVAQARAEGRQSLHFLEVQDWKTRSGALLADGSQANPPDPPPEPRKKGRRKQSPARNVLARLCAHQDAVLAFLENFAVPFDNSQAERDIRMVKVPQKVSGCFRSEAGAHAFCRIRGYLSTLRKQGMPVLTALEQALVGHPVFPAF